MEDTLRAGSSSKSEVSNSVLILVLMEDTLRGIIIKHSERRGNGLNPCSNGRYSQSYPHGLPTIFRRVLILVLMEDTLRTRHEDLSDAKRQS